MIRSMTGFGQASRMFAGYQVFIEMKSVNHRYCEVAIRMPKEWACYEEALRKTVMNSVKRGRVDVFVTVERESSSQHSVTVNWALLDGYLQAAEQLERKYGFSDPLTRMELLKLPELVQLKEARAELDDSVEQELLLCLEEACAHLTSMRQREGANLARDVMDRLSELAQLREELHRFAPQVVKDYATKLRSRIAELLQEQSPIDENRLATEIALFADRSNVDEELTRLQSHFQQFTQLMDADDPIGRKLDFLIQEMNREVNTIGSKANHSELSSRVIDMKADLEKMREQIQNIE